ncbi:Holliday junction resolvase YggF [Cutibacterium acnes JCM 18916]|nr:Holliday junction resolvase YggF [Cutibacterium acnes JCM 18916]
MNPAERPDTSLCGVRLAIDWGKARIGVAASDRDAILAFPVETVHTADRPVQRLAEIVAEYEPVEVIMGLPVALMGPSSWPRKMFGMPDASWPRLLTRSQCAGSMRE